MKTKFKANDVVMVKSTEVNALGFIGVVKRASPKSEIFKEVVQLWDSPSLLLSLYWDDELELVERP